MPTATLSHCTISYVDGGQGAPLVFVHGFPLDHTMWQHQIEAFRATHRVIAIDLPGFGASTTSAPLSIIGLADQLEEFIDSLGLPTVVLCGLSMGGSIAQQFAVRHPQRLTGLILCDCRAMTDPPETQKMRHDLADRVLREGPEFVAQAMPARLFSARSIAQQPVMVESIQSVIRATSPQSVAGGSRALADREDMVPRLKEITARTLLIVGQDDVISTVDEMRNIAQKIPNAQLVEIPGAGHMAPLETPDLVNDALRAWFG
jgi:3-oxoadipate enol-lactonase